MDATPWSDRYATAEYVWKADPNVFLATEAATLAPGRALDLACGEGRNAVWLAEQEWAVTGVDLSDVGLDKGRRLAAERRKANGVAARVLAPGGTLLVADHLRRRPRGRDPHGRARR